MKRALPLLLFIAAACLTRLPILHRAVLDWDESLYFLMAQEWRAGHLPYTTIWDNKPLGIYAIFALFQSFIPGVAAMRVATALCVGGLATVVFYIARRLTREEGAGWVAGGLVVLCALSNDGLSANSELFMALFTACAVLVALTEGPAWVAGLALGCGFMVKYVMAPEALAVLALLYHERGLKPAALAALAAALPLAGAAGLYAAAGQLPLWWECSLASNLRRAAVPGRPGALEWALSTQFWRWGPLYLTAAAMLVPARRRGFVSNFPLLWLGTALLGAVSARSFYDHYFLQVLPPLAVLAGQAWARLRPGGAVRDILLLALISLPLQAGWRALHYAMGHDEPAAIAAAIRTLHPHSLYIFDSQPIIYALTGTTPPTRFVLPSELTGLTLPAVAGVDPVAEVARILATRPQYILRREPQPGPGTGNAPVYAELNAALAAHYRLIQSWHGAALYQRDPN